MLNMDFGLPSKKIDMSVSKEFWNTDEIKGYTKIKADDNNYYKVWTGDPDEKFQKNWWYEATDNDKKMVANTLASVNKDITKLLRYIDSISDTWINEPIAFGIYHTLELHLHNNFEYLEMRPNKWGCLGLNKPREISVLKIKLDSGKNIDYELGTKRNISLTLRNQNTGELRKYADIMNLAVHELTHTTCNDVRWVPEWKGGNHREPYPTYHRMMRKWAFECGLNIN